MSNRTHDFKQPIQIQTDNRHVTKDLSELKKAPEFTPTLYGGMSLPFASGNTTVAVASNSTTGGFANMMVVGFGGAGYANVDVSGSQTYPQLGGTFPIKRTGSADNYTNIYMGFPCDIIITGIHFNVTAGATINVNGSTVPCVALATADVNAAAGWSQFTILQETQISATGLFIKGGSTGQGVTYAGEKTDMSVFIPAGKLMAIACGVYTVDGTKNISLSSLNFAGCITYRIPEYESYQDE